MKITITLSDAEVKGIKNYLKDIADLDRPNKEDIHAYINNLVSGSLHTTYEAISDYIKAQENNHL